MLTHPGRSRVEAPRAPPEIAEAVELYAREHGRTGSIEFAIGPNVWLAKFSLRPNDPRMKAYQMGMAPEPPVETTWFQVSNPKFGQTVNGVKQPPFLALDIFQMGPDSVRAFLQRGNVESGRGEHSSLLGAFEAADRKNEELKDRNREDARRDARDWARENRRWYERWLPANWRHHLTTGR